MDGNVGKGINRIFDAVERDDLENVRTIVEREGLPPSITRYHSGVVETPAHLAARKGHLKLFKYLVEKDPSVLKKVAYHSDSPAVFEVAIQHGRLDIVKYLVESQNFDIFQENDISVPDYSTSPVSLAVSSGHLDIVKYFVEERHVNVNTGTPKEEAPLDEYNVRPLLFHAVKEGQHNIAKYLVEERKANLNKIDRDRRNILYVAVDSKDLNFLKYVLDEKKVKIDVNWRDYFGETLVYHAVLSNCVEILQYLVEEKKADLNIPEKDRRWTPLHMSILKEDGVFRYLVDHGADLEKKDVNEATPLHLAVTEKENAGKCEYLLKHGAVVHPKNKIGRTPVEIAILEGNHKAGVHLIDYSSDDDINGTYDSRGEALIHKVATNDQIELLHHLVSKKHVNVNAVRGCDQWTPLHCAAFYGHLAICKYLIEHGADPQMKTELELTAAELAGIEEVIQYIRNAAVNVRSRRSVGHPVWLPAPQLESHRYNRVAQTSYESQATTFINEVPVFYFQNFLISANLFIARLFGRPAAVDTDYKHVSSVGISRRERDHVAEDAIRTFQAFEEARK